MMLWRVLAHWDFHWLSLALELRCAPEDAGEQAFSRSGEKDADQSLLPQEEKTGQQLRPLRKEPGRTTSRR